jgi:site-specific DNA-methyltransferase (adenine-specific)
MNLLLGDCLQVLPDAVEDGTVALCFVDPPYNIGVFRKMPEDEYLDWCEQWIALCSAKLKPNGAFWVSHKNPRLLCKLSEMIAAHGRGLINWVTWDKYNGNPAIQAMGGPMVGMTMCDGLRSFQVMAEYLIYHTDEGNWTAQCDRERGFIFEPLRAYLEGERKRAGVSRAEIDEFFGTSNVTQYWWQQRGWRPPTQERYEGLRQFLNVRGNHGGEYLRREYEDLRREYEDLRYTFNNPGKMSSVWQIPPAPRNGHPTPKPPELLRRIVTITSNPGDVVLDPMMGSGTTGVVCAETGRDFIGCEIAPRWYQMACEAVNQEQQLELAL